MRRFGQAGGYLEGAPLPMPLYDRQSIDNVPLFADPVRAWSPPGVYDNGAREVPVTREPVDIRPWRQPPRLPLTGESSSFWQGEPVEPPRRVRTTRVRSHPGAPEARRGGRRAACDGQFRRS
jgi:hypothetical protein